jgi:hypothetical protein
MLNEKSAASARRRHLRASVFEANYAKWFVHKLVARE